jgi:hypothetical protein
MLSRLILFSIVLLTSLGASNCGTARLEPDLGVSAVVAGDSTAFVEGCGNMPIEGYTYCRKMEGDTSNGKIWFHAPPSQCDDKDSCVSLKIYIFGEDPMGFTFPKGITKVGVEWKAIIGKNIFEVHDRGFYPFDYTIKWNDKAGREQFTFVDGEIRLVVYTKEYVPLHDVEEDPNFVWIWEDGGCVYKMTTGGRSNVKCEDKE